MRESCQGEEERGRTLNVERGSANAKRKTRKVCITQQAPRGAMQELCNGLCWVMHDQTNQISNAFLRDLGVLERA